jgi:hypothetical protein
MALYNLVRVETSTLSTADVVTGAAVSGYLTFALAGVPNGATVTYGLQDLDTDGSVLASEVGRGVWDAGTLTLARTTVVNSTNGGAKIVLGGTAEVYITAIAQDFTDLQPYDATLASIAGLGTAADKMIYTTGIDTWAEATITAAGRSLLDDATTGDMLTTLGAAASGHTHAQLHDALTLGLSANGLSLAAGQVLSLGLASTGVTGALSGSDWDVFNAKQPAGAYLTSVTADSPLSGAGTSASHLVVDLSSRQAADAGLTSLAGLTYVSTAFVKMTGVDTFTLDTATYEPADATIVKTGNASWIDLTDGGATTLHAHNYQAPLSFPLAASLGGTGIANGASATLTLPNLSITLGGGGAAQTYTLPAVGGTFALLNAANVFTGIQKINVNSTTALLVEQDGVKDNTFIVDTTNGRVSIGGTPVVGAALSIEGSEVGRMLRLKSKAPSYPSFLSLVDSNNVELGLFSYASNGGTFSMTNTTISPTASVIVRGGVNSVSYFNAGFIGFGNTSPQVRQHVTDSTTTTNAILEVLRIEAIVSTASTGGAAGFGTSFGLSAESATDTVSKQQGRLWSKWVVPTNSSETSAVGLDAYYNSTAREFISGEATTTAVMLSFFGGTRAIQQVLAAYTSDGEGSAYTGAADGEAKLADLNQLRVAYETLRASYDDLRTKLQTSTLVA